MESLVSVEGFRGRGSRSPDPRWPRSASEEEVEREMLADFFARNCRSSSTGSDVEEYDDDECASTDSDDVGEESDAAESDFSVGDETAYLPRRECVDRNWTTTSTSGSEDSSSESSSISSSGTDWSGSQMARPEIWAHCEAPDIPDAKLVIVIVLGKLESKHSNFLTLGGMLFQDTTYYHVMRYVFDAEICFEDSTAGVIEEADKLLSGFCDHQPGRDGLGIVFIGYSMGGIILKQALLMAMTSRKYRHIADRTIGVLFLGVPQRDTEAAPLPRIYAKILKSWRQWADNKRSLDAPTLSAMMPMLRALRMNNKYFTRLTSAFQALIACPVYSLYETRPVEPNSTVVVDKDATLLGNEIQMIPVSGSHLDLISCNSFDDDAYVKVRFVVKTLFDQYVNDTIQDLKMLLLGTVSPQAADSSEPTACLDLVVVRPLPQCCPVCSSLQPDASQLSSTAALEFRVPRNAWMSGDIGLWSRRCGLARLVDWLSRPPRARRAALLQGIPPGICLMNRPVSAVEMQSRSRRVRKRRGLLSAELGHPISPLLRRIVVPREPSITPSSWALMGYWWRKCDQQHDQCRASLPLLPTRVLDISDFDCIQLVLLPNQRNHYVALSHCWGQSSAFTTTKETLEARQRGFSHEIAPKTFRDAMLVSRKLGFRYLWIDSLCIIQGDAQDWEAEGSRMADVYGNASLTILAANASDDAEGFLSPRPFDYTKVRVKLRQPNNFTDVYLSRHPVPSGIEAVDKRGWIMQEQYLAPRMLRFGARQIIWSCKTTCWQEAHLDPVDMRPPESKIQQGILPELSKALPWLRLVEEFTSRALTRRSDSLPAMAGIASMLAESNEFKYCAGFWWRDMPACLLFRRLVRSRATKYVAPSWSWAASEALVRYGWDDTDKRIPLENLQPWGEVKVLDYFVDRPPATPYMGLRGVAWLKVRAPLVLVKHSAEEQQTMPPTMTFKIRHFRFAKGVGRQTLFCYFDQDPLDITQDVYAVTLVQSESNTWYGLLVRKTASVRSESGLDSRLNGLFASERVSAESLSDGYERVGVFKVDYMNEVTWEKVLEDYPVQEFILY